MCLSEVLSLMMLKLGGPRHKSQQLTQLQFISEAHAACTFRWDQQHSLLSKWLGGLWSIDWLSLAWFLYFKQKDRFCQLPFVSYHLETEEDLKHILCKWNRDDELSLAFDSKVWEWNCRSVGATSQDLGCLVKWRVPLLVYEIEHEDLYATLPNKNWLMHLSEASCIWR